MPVEKKKQRSEEEAATAASSSAAVFSFLARPLSLLRHVARGCAGYPVRRRRPTAPPSAAAKQDGDEAATAEEEHEVVIVQLRSRAMPGRPRGLREGPGGNGGAHH